MQFYCFDVSQYILLASILFMPNAFYMQLNTYSIEQIILLFTSVSRAKVQLEKLTIFHQAKIHSLLCKQSRKYLTVLLGYFFARYCIFTPFCNSFISVLSLLLVKISLIGKYACFMLVNLSHAL